MPTLTNRTVASSYKELLKVNMADGITTDLAFVEDGDGTQSALSISVDAVRSEGKLRVLGLAQLDNNVEVGGNLTVSGNAVIQGTLTANGGTLTLGDADTDNVVFNADVNSHILPNTDNTYDLGSAAKSWRNLHVDSTATINNISITGSQTITATTQSTDKDTGALVVEGGVGIEKNTNIGGNLAVTGDLAVNGGDLTTTAATFNLLNANATSVNFAGAGTSVEIGAATGTTNVNNNLDVDGDLNIDGGDLTVSTSTFNLANTTATTLNLGGAATTVEIGAATGTTNVNNNLVVDLDLQVKGGDLTTDQTTFNLLNTTATTVNFAGAATTMEIGAATGTTSVNNDLTVDGNTTLGNATSDTVTFTARAASSLVPSTDDASDLGASTLEWKDLFIDGTAKVDTLTVDENASVAGDLTVTGNLTVNGTTTTVNSTTLTVDDKNIELGSVATPTDVTADGGGITLKGSTDKTLNWVDATDSWTSSEHVELASGKTFRINGASVLSASTLGSGVTASSLTSVGTVGTGTWQGTIISPTYGGTGVNNASRTITLGGSLTTSGAHTTTLTTTGNTGVTLPTTGTLATLAGTETLTNKSINLANNTLTATSAEIATAVTDETGSGSLVFSTNPALVTPSLGVASATSINKVNITTPTTSATLTIANGKTLTASNTLTFTGTDSSSVAFGTGGTVAYTADKLSVFASTSSSELAGVLSDETGTGSVVFSASPALTGTPTAPTAAADTNTTQIATTAHVFAERSNTAILTNKTLTSPTINTPVLTVNDSSLTIQDNADATKKAQFEASGISAGQTRTFTLPNVNMNVAGYTTTGTPAWTIDQAFVGFLNLTLANGTTVKVPYYS